MVIRPPWYYRLAIMMARPVYWGILAHKKDKLPYYEREMAERFGHHYLPLAKSDKGVIWCHAVSLGELNTAYPLLKLLLDDNYHLWITSTTQTGFARAKTLFADRLGKTVQHSFVPVDDVAVLQRFLSHVRPVMAVFVETELWANTLYLLASKGITSVMANARLTDNSFDGYRKFARLSQSMMANLSLIIVQDAQSHANFIALGADNDKVKLAHSLKWSSATNQPFLHKTTLGHRPVWVMASTHDGEESLALAVHQRLLTHLPNALLILVPRHPERFDDVAKLCQDFIYHRRSQTDIQDDTQVYLADSMGELMAWYGLCDVAVVGGSFVDKGGHNPIEPARVAKPIIMGRYVKNCAEIVADLVGVQALVQVQGDDESELFDVLKFWLDDPNSAKHAGEQGKQLADERRQADKQQFAMIHALLTKQASK